MHTTCSGPVKVALNKDHYGFADTVQWVPAHLIVATNHQTWGEFSYRCPGSPRQFTSR